MGENNPIQNRMTAFMLALSAYYSGYTMPIFNSMAGPILHGHFGLSQETADQIQGNLNSLFCVAAALGVLAMNNLINRFGRVGTTKALDVVILGLNLLFLFDSIFALLTVRLIGGFITGLYSACSSVILVELMPKSHSEFGNLMICALLGLFGLVSYINQMVLSPEVLQNNWRLIMIWPTAISVFRLVYLCKHLPEDTPTFAYRNYCHTAQLRSKLETSFLQVYKVTGLEAQVEKFVLESSSEQISLKSQFLLEPYKQLFSDKLWKKTFGCVVLRFLEAFTGFPVLCFISTSFFTKMGLNGKLISLIFGLFSVIGSLSGIYFVSRFRRVPTMFTGTLVQAATLLAIWLAVLWSSPVLVIIALACYLMGYWSGIGASHCWQISNTLQLSTNARSKCIGGVAGLYIAETLPAAGVGFCTCLSWLTWGFVAKVCVSFTHGVGETNALFAFACICVGIAFILRSVLIESEPENLDAKEVPLIELTEKNQYNNSLERQGFSPKSIQNTI